MVVCITNHLDFQLHVSKMEKDCDSISAVAKPPRKKRRQQGPSVRRWVFTDYGEKDTDGKELVPEAWLVLPTGVTFLTWQLEKGEKKQKLHLQGYVELDRSRYVSWLHKRISATAGFIVARGTCEQASVYVHKEKTRQQGPWTLGQPSKGVGHRTDLDEYYEAIARGDTARKMAVEHRVCFARYPRVYEKLRALYRPKYDPRDEATKVILLIGKTGCGKTLSVYKQWADSDDFYEIPLTTSGLWYDGYDQHKYVLMDDFSGANKHVGISILLKLLDTYPRNVATKGGFTWYNPQRIIMTSNIHPYRWYDFYGREEEYDALARRICNVVFFDEHNEPYEAPDDFWEKGKTLQTYWSLKREVKPTLRPWMDVLYPKKKKLWFL